MVTGELNSQIDRIWDSFWSGEISNPNTPTFSTSPPSNKRVSTEDFLICRGNESPGLAGRRCSPRGALPVFPDTMIAARVHRGRVASESWTRLDMVDLCEGHFRVRDDIGNDIHLLDVAGADTASTLVGQRVTAPELRSLTTTAGFGSSSQPSPLT